MNATIIIADPQATVETGGFYFWNLERSCQCCDSDFGSHSLLSA